MKPVHGRAVHHLGRTARGVLRFATCPIEVVPARSRRELTMPRSPSSRRAGWSREPPSHALVGCTVQRCRPAGRRLTRVRGSHSAAPRSRRTHPLSSDPDWRLTCHRRSSPADPWSVAGSLRAVRRPVLPVDQWHPRRDRGRRPAFYRHFADRSLLPGLTAVWDSVFMEHAAAFGLVVAAGEGLLAALLLGPRGGTAWAGPARSRSTWL